MTRVLMFDLGGVLVENDMFSALQTLMATQATEAELKAKWLSSSTARSFELGFCTPEQFANSIVQEFEIQTSPECFLESFVTWPKGFSSETRTFLGRLRAHHRTGCLSNSNELHWTDQVTSLFDHSYSSHLINRIKPDMEAFEYVAHDLGATPNEIVFFDDSQPNVDAANAFGWEAHLTVGFDALRSTINKLGIRG